MIQERLIIFVQVISLITFLAMIFDNNHLEIIEKEIIVLVIGLSVELGEFLNVFVSLCGVHGFGDIDESPDICAA
jgi:hypothetical protein